MNKYSAALFIWLLLLARAGYGATVPSVNNSINALDDGVTSITASSFAVGATSPLILCTVSQYGVTITGVTFNSISMLPVGSELNQYSAYFFSMWKLTGQSGTHNVVVSFSGSAGHVVLLCTSFINADQTTPIGTEQTSLLDYENNPVSITVPTDGLAYGSVGAFLAAAGCGDLVPTGPTQINDVCSNQGAGNSNEVADGYRTTTGTMKWSFLGGEVPFQIAVPINPIAAAPSGVSRRMVVGVQ